MNKVVDSIQQAIKAVGLKDGMTISFHHHMRNGDYVMNMVLDAIAQAGIKDITVNSSSFFDVHAPILDHIRNGVVTGLECNYMSSLIGKAVSEGILEKPVVFRSHGGRPSDMEKGTSHIDVAFVAAPTCDGSGNCTGKIGKSACGPMGYAVSDAMYADKVVAITDNLVEKLDDISIDGKYIDFIVNVDQIGDPKGIVSGTTQITRDPVGLRMAENAAKVIKASGLLKDGFSFQTGAGGATLAASKFVREMMIKEGIQGSFCLGGITSYMVQMLHEGLFKELLDVQCFDLDAVRSLSEDSNHKEITASEYAGVCCDSAVNHLDAALLGATQVDLDFNVNVHTDSNGYIIGGSGGHSDVAAGSKLCIIIAPLTRARLPLVVDRVVTISTPGNTIDVLVTQRGIAVNTKYGKNKELKQRLIDAHLPIMEIEDLKRIAEQYSGVPSPLETSDRVVGNVIYRDGTQIDTIKMVLGN